MGRTPAELGSGLGSVDALIEQEDFGEIVAQACPSLILGTGDRSGSVGCDGGRLRHRVLSVPAVAAVAITPVERTS